jgi:TMEM175 potassium channel family protein
MTAVTERDAAKETGRLETFADGVFAIAITLLVLEIRTPDPGQDLGAALLAQWPSFAAYVTSFLTIGVMWVSHHQMFTIIRRTTTTFLFLNVLFLLPVAFVPYPTALVAGHILDAGSRTTAVLVYGALSVVIAVMFNVLWAYAFRNGLVAAGRGADRARQVSRGFLIGPLIYLGATLLAFVNPFISMAVFAGLAVYWMLPGNIPSD